MRAINSVLVLVLISSCEKVIEVDLNDAVKRLVIEGVVTNVTGTSMVLLSETKNFNQNNDFAGVSGASIAVTDNSGNETTYTETAPGVYEAPLLTGVPGGTYSLRVTLNGQVFTATSTMPQPVNMDSLFITDDVVVNKTRKLVNVTYHDPAGPGNCYRFIQYVNGWKERQIFVRNDVFMDGNASSIKLRYLAGEEDYLAAGDSVRVNMMCIDAAVYKYWFSLDQGATGDNNAATPANPVTNIQGGALGVFSAHTLQTKSIVVQ